MFDIVMPLFNKQSFVARSIESVLAQSFQHWSLFVVDDGSTDQSVAAVERFHDPRIKLIGQANAGPGPARNNGICAGNSDWIAFLDADDLWMPYHLEQLDRLRTQFPDAVLIGTAFQRWNGGPVSAIRSGDAQGRLIRYFREAADGNLPFFMSSIAVPRRAVLDVGLMKPALTGEDTDLWARLAMHGPVAVSTGRTALYRVETGGITDTEASVDGRCPPLPASVRDLGLPIPTLVDRIAHVADPELRRDISDYIDREVGAALMHHLRKGQVEHARRLISFFRTGPRGKARVATFLARLPAPLGPRILEMILMVKRSIRSLSGSAG